MARRNEENVQKTFSCHLLYLFFILMGVKNVLLMLVLLLLPLLISSNIAHTYIQVAVLQVI